MNMVLESLADVALDTLKVLPFLFLAYLAMEYIESKMSRRTAAWLESADKMGPLIGAAAGVVPQCGFSATAAGFYAGGLLTTGTLIAVFLSTSDEMLPVLLAASFPIGRIRRILGWKVGIAAVTGLLIDLVFRKRKVRPSDRVRIHAICEEDHCSCGGQHGGILKPALRHTGKTALFIFVISFLAALLIGAIGQQRAAAFLAGRRVLGVLISALIGLIPNCGASVMITQLYAEGIFGAGQMMAGLLVSAGVGLLVLFRNDRRVREDLLVTGLLLLSGIVWGLLITLLGIRL